MRKSNLTLLRCVFIYSDPPPTNSPLTVGGGGGFRGTVAPPSAGEALRGEGRSASILRFLNVLVLAPPGYQKKVGSHNTNLKLCKMLSLLVANELCRQDAPVHVVFR